MIRRRADGIRLRKHTSKRHRGTTPKMRGRTALAVLASIVVLAGALVPGLAAEAAGGPAVLDATMSPVDYATGDAQTTAAFGTHGDKLAYRVNFSCSTASCTGATVTIPKSQPDPYGLAGLGPSLTGQNIGKYLLTYGSWTKPAGMDAATISGDEDTGLTISLGDLAAGASGSFLVIYDITPTDTYSTARPAQFYPDGFQIDMSATIDATNSTAAVTANAAPVTWHNQVPTPGVVSSNPGTVSPGTNVVYSLAMASGAFPRRDSSAATGTSQWVAASNYVVTEQLAPEAVYVQSSNGGVYDAATHTVTWTAGSVDAPDYLAAGGWGLNSFSGWVGRNGYGPRTVTVQYPAANFPQADATGCNFTATVASVLTTTVTYLDSARTTKTASATTSNNVACYDPFGRVGLTKDSTNNGSFTGGRVVYVPDSGQAANNFYWRVDVSNGGNEAGVATVVDDALDQQGAHVNQISAPTGSTVNWTLNDGTTGSSTTTYKAPTGTWFTKSTVVTAPIQPVNVSPNDTRAATVSVYYYYSVPDTAPVGETRTNTASMTMTYPDAPELGTFIAPDASRTIRFDTKPVAKPGFTAAFPSAPVVAGGGNAVPGSSVTFSIGGTTANLTAGAPIEPQYVFIAPAGWTIEQNSATFASGAPEGVTYDYRSVVVGGVPRDAVVATWPADAPYSISGAVPTMTVVATPTYEVAAGTTSTATAWLGDTAQQWDNTAATYTSAVHDTTDVVGDGAARWFSSSTQSALVSSADGLTPTKQICRTDLTMPDQCDWVSDPDQPVGVSTTASDIRYRIVLQNTGNTTLSDVVAYDVLPYIGDVGTSQATAATPRGSTFAESLASVANVSPNLSLSYSASTNPTRNEVYPGAPGAVEDWSSDAADASGAKAIRASVTGSLAPGDTVSFDYVANVASGSPADAIACNSVAVDSDKTLPSEPRPVCADTQEADLSITVPKRLPLQVGRPGVLPFTVTNGGGSQAAPATVTVDVPSGLTVTDLAPEGWTCTVEQGGTAPVSGPVKLDCDAVDGDGAPRTLQKGMPDALNVPVAPTVAAATLCVPAVVTGPMNDPDQSNNDTSGCLTVAAATAGLALSKDDGRATVSVGDEYTYRITASNLLPGESIADAIVTDTLPAGLAFVSASGGGSVTGQGAADAFGNKPGGTVTWAIPSLAGAGTITDTGDDTSGAAGSIVTLTVTVKVVPDASGAVTNVAAISAADPADTTASLHADTSDTDGLRALAITKSSDARASGVRVGDTVTYTVTATDRGTADYTADVPAVIHDDLTGVLDDATFVAGSATASVEGGTAAAVSNPTAGILTWSGALTAGSSVVVTYRVAVTDSGDKVLTNAAFAGVPISACDPATGADEGGLPCAITSSTFAPVLTKTVASFAQNDDGTWTTVYDLDVKNPNPGTTVGYALSDDLAYGTGIDVLTAAITGAPDGVSPAAWSGTGPVVAGAALAGGQTHQWEITVTANAHGVASTPPGSCLADAASGFENTATLTLSDATTQTADACAEPKKPTVTKTLDGAPVRNADGSWNVSYLITVTNASTTPLSGLVYSLRDQLAYPKGVSVSAVTVDDLDGSGAALDPDFNGGLTTVDGAGVAADTDLLASTDRVSAATSDGAGQHRYRVTVTARATESALTVDDVTCGPDGSHGYKNSAELWSTDTLIGTGSACVDIAVPKLRFTKTADTTGVVHPGDTIRYTITAKNVGNADFIAGDPAALQDDMSGVLDDAGYGTDAKASSGVVVYAAPTLYWSGAIGVGKTVTITYTVTAGKVGAGDGRIENVVSLPDDPAATIPTCPTAPDGNSGPCEVSNRLVAAAATGGAGGAGLADTGSDLSVPLALGLLALGFGAAIAFLTRRRRATSK